MISPASPCSARRSLGYQTDLAVLAHQGARCSQRDGYLAVQTPDNPEFWWGNFLLLPELDARTPLCEWLARFAAEFPQARHCTLGLDTLEPPDPQVLAAFTALGFTLVRSSVLTAHQTAPCRALPPGTELRPLRSGDDWHQALNLGLALNAANPEPLPGYLPFLEGRLRLLRWAQERGEGAMWGAFVGGQLRSSLGIYQGGHQGQVALARYQRVETHPEWRSQGLAGGLVHAAGEWARAALGAHILVIVADPEYHAQALYQGLGFSVRESCWGLQRPPAPEAT
ncbi:N-acetyltransferase [Deinococcus piscis]|uniref:N-acetyltransferase n=1 Tax=Deinococcus piscis TaxID=394230 RepID=A0ABQ3K995_9DEIO|nr:GNAT family N-acetyltransferase [Deinococcus piscis]GHG03495.1 N-acetyltransferase [Deinococcus piscis]